MVVHATAIGEPAARGEGVGTRPPMVNGAKGEIGDLIRVGPTASGEYAYRPVCKIWRAKPPPRL